MQIATNVWYVKNILANCDGNVYLPIAHLPRVDESFQKNCTVWQGLYTCMVSIPIFTLRTRFSFYLIDFFHSETNVKSLRRSRESIFALQAPQHHHNTTVTHLFSLNLLFHSWSNLLLWLFIGLRAEVGVDPQSLGLEHHRLHPYTTLAKAERP